MPFERYLQSRNDPYDDYASGSSQPRGYHPPPLDPATFSHNVQFQLPQLILGPTLAPGGGAEVLPAGIFNPSGAVASNWFSKYEDSDPAQCPSQYDPVQTQNYMQHPVHTPFAHLPPPLPYHSSSAIGLPAFSIPSSSFPIPSTLGLPIYSASGFDLLSILARVATRPNPKVVLGPVDLTCSFVVVDIRRFDSPIVYASPSFCTLTGYSEQEVLGRNCRFLQAPDGRVHKGDVRRYTAPDAVAHLRKSLSADKECQTSILNYRKNGEAFINLVTVIPVPGGANNAPEEADEVVYHVGFQVDLTEQPTTILQKFKDGSYQLNPANNVSLSPSAAPSTRDWRTNATAMSGASKQLRALLANPAFLASVPLTKSTTPLPVASTDKLDLYDGNKLLHLLLLETSPDFVHVLSLKGYFLYVSPSVRRVLAYEPDDLLGKSITDFCHKADVVPLMRELKESSATPASAHDPASAPAVLPTPKTVDLLFRVRNKHGDYVWLECRGRLHVEPGKGRKAIILSGRVRPMPRLDWGPVARAGGLSHPTQRSERDCLDTECWAMLSSTGTFLFVGAALRDLLGWGAGEAIGMALGDFVGGPNAAESRANLEHALAQTVADASTEARSLSCELERKDGSLALVRIVLYQPQDTHLAPARPVVCQVALIDPALSTTVTAHFPSEDVFEEFDVARDSSWQYELQQLKFANQRLMEEVDELEAGIRDDAHDWVPPSQVPMKRPWDSVVDGGPA